MTRPSAVLKEVLAETDCGTLRRKSVVKPSKPRRYRNLLDDEDNEAIHAYCLQNAYELSVLPAEL